MRRLKQLSLAIVATLLALLVSEGAFRALYSREVPVHSRYVDIKAALDISPHPFYPDYDGPPHSAYSFYRYKPNSQWANQYPDNARGRFDENNQVVYRMNSDGYRDYEFVHGRARHGRVIVIGDSFTFGEGVQQEECYAKVLEAELQGDYQGIEVYNLGVNGYGIRDQLVCLEQSLADYQPDFVVWGFLLNDISHAELQVWTEVQRRALASTQKTPSYLLNYLLLRGGSQRFARDYRVKLRELYDSPTYWNELSSLVRRMSHEIRAAARRLLVVVFPEIDAFRGDHYLFEDLHQRLHSLFDEAEIDYIDLTDDYRVHGAGRLKVHAIDAHPNEIGHRLAADAIRQWISRHPEALEITRSHSPDAGHNE